MHASATETRTRPSKLTHAKSVAVASIPEESAMSGNAHDDVNEPAIVDITAPESATSSSEPVVDMPAPEPKPTGGAVDGSDLNDTGYRLGDRIEVYWIKEKKWFGGSVADNTKVHSYKNGNRKLHAPQLQIKYDDGETLSHSLHNTEVRHINSVPSVFMLLAERAADANLHDADTTMEEFVTPDSEREHFYFLTDIDIDVMTGEALNTISIFAIAEDGALLAAAKVNSMDTLNARYWHEPKNEREFMRSPQRALWLTAKELKWDQYLHLNMFDWVLLSSVDRKKHVIYNTLWAYKIKLNSDTTFKKLNPRWCLKGTSMDRDVFKSHAETLRMSSFRIIMALKGGYWKAFCDILLDCSDAFQATRTDGEFEGSMPDVYCWPAPGFEKHASNGERYVCKLNCGMQGRIDATRMFNGRLFALLLVKANMARALWDRQVIIYHNGPLAQTDKSLTEILLSIKHAKDTPSQQPPIGYAVLGWHVDDGTGVACDVGWHLDYKSNRIVQFIRGTIETLYATTLTGWHGQKALGFTLTLDEQRRSVTMSAPDAVAQLAKDLLQDAATISPKHACTKDFFGIEAGVVPEVGDPTRDAVLTRMALTRHGLGVCIWLQNAYISIMRGTGALCKNMASPHEQTLKCLRYQVMFLVSNGVGITWGGFNRFGLERPESVDVSMPMRGERFMFLHFFSDANLDMGSVSGGIAMLAGGCVLAISQNQHLSAPCSHTAETVAAGTNVNLLVPIAGLLQELSVLQGSLVPFYLDSDTTVKVAKSDTAIKKSVWLIRRAAVLEDCVVHGIIEVHHIPERDMAADPFTKYLPYNVWSRHMHYVLNLAGPLPSHPKSVEGGC